MDEAHIRPVGIDSRYCRAPELAAAVAGAADMARLERSRIFRSEKSGETLASF